MLPAHTEAPPGTIPSHMVSNGELRGMGYDPTSIRRLEDGLAGVGLGLGLTPGQIPRPQSQRVAMYEKSFGAFDSGKNAYWSLRKERPVSLAEGARFDVAMRAGKLAPAAIRGAAVEFAPRMVNMRYKPTIEQKIAGVVGRILPVVPQVVQAVTGRPGPPPVPFPPAPAFAKAGMLAGLPPWAMPALLALAALVIVPKMLGKKRRPQMARA